MAATLKCDTIQNASSATANLTLDASGNATVGNTLAMGSSFKRNRIINGDMRVDQRNAGASVTPTIDQTYTVDRWQLLNSQASKISLQRQTSVVPTGFTYATKITSLAATSLGAGDYFCYAQPIEGFNVADWSWGTANAQTVTLSFWVYSSLTGTFGGCISNSAQNRAYPFTYSISSANTWTYITKTITGDTTGTWPSDNTRSVWVIIGLGVGTTYSGTAGAWTAGVYLGATGATSVVGTNGATFYITGVQLEVGSIATPYERQIYSEQLAQCQRYYETTYNVGVTPGSSSSIGARSFYSQDFSSRQYLVGSATFAVPKRATPNVTIYSPGGTSGAVWNSSDTNTGAGATANNIGVTAFRYINMATTIVGALGTFTLHFVAEAEL